MQELLIDFITSLDGYAAAEGWPGWWGLEGPEYLTWFGQAIGTNPHRSDGGQHLSADVRDPASSANADDPGFAVNEPRCPRSCSPPRSTSLPVVGEHGGWSADDAIAAVGVK